MLRTPLLPFSALAEWGAGLEAASRVGDVDALDDAVARDTIRLRERLAALVEGSEFREALFIASPSLEAALQSWKSDPEEKQGQKVERSLVCYFSRAAARPTPFGLFGGCATGGLGRRTRLMLDGVERYRRQSRLDMDYLWRIAESVERDPQLRRHFIYRPNSSLYDLGDRVYLAEAVEENGGRSYRLVGVDKTPYLKATLERARGGAHLHTLAAALVDGEVTQSDAEEYLDELVESQVLTADVRPPLTGQQPTDALIRTLQDNPDTAPLAGRLKSARRHLAAIDASGVGTPPESYRALASALEGLPAKPQLARLVQVDLFKPGRELSLGDNVVAEIARGVDALHAMSRAVPAEGLTRFRERFVRRYETREVPLLEALDEESGIGFERSTSPPAEGGQLVAGLPLNQLPEGAARWTRRDALLLDKLTHALAAGSSEIAIEDADLDAVVRRDTLPLPDAFEVLASVEAASADAVDRGEFRVLVQSAAGPPGARLLGRFCHADASLHRLVMAHLRAEEQARNDCAFAEIVHLPEGRVGNILSRPVLRDYEIPYLARSGAPRERQLPASDLLVTVEGERIVLRSRKLDREVVPRLTTAHNHEFRSLGVYRFLCALQHQSVVPGLMWDWGPLGSAPFLPRVTHGRAVLSRATWNLNRDDLAAFREPRGAARFAAVHELRAARGLARYVALIDADNELVVDLENVLSIDALSGQLKTRTSAALAEMLPSADGLWVSGPEGLFCHQLVVPFGRSSPQRSVKESGPRPSASPARRFPPGSEWLYVKLFCGTATADRVLDAASRAIESSLASNAADRWFFIRYSDPDWHVRVRVHGDPPRLLGETLPAIYARLAPLLQAGQLWRVQLDTYEREIERYGGDRGIQIAEEIFHADSDAVLAVMRTLDGQLGSEDRWQVALAGIDRLFDDFRLTLDQKRALTRRACEGYGREFGGGREFQREVSRRYRQERRALEALVDGHRRRPPAASRPALEALRVRSAAVEPLADELRRRADRGHLSASLPELVMSYAHMHVNRLLRSVQRAQEFVLYEMLDRIYTSAAARRRDERSS